MEILIIWLAFCFLVAIMAEKKGRSGVGFFLLSVIISPLLGLLFVLASSPDNEAKERAKLESGQEKKCPFCAELIKAEASVCRFCGRDILSRAISANRSQLASAAHGATARRIAAYSPALVSAAARLRDYRIATDGRESGPYSRLELLEMWAAGRITDSSFYWKEGMAEWRPVEELV